MGYPNEFSLAARDRIENEKILACRKLLPSRACNTKTQDLAIRCIMRIFLAFAREACTLRKDRAWTIDRVRSQSEEFLRKLTITVLSDKFPDLHRRWICNLDGSLESDVVRRFKASAEWKEYEELLLTVSLGASIVQKQPVDNLRNAHKQRAELTDHELKIWAVIQRKVKGLQYCRELDNAGIAPLRSGVWKDCSRKYESAYLEGKPWCHRIQDEKSKIQRKAKLAGLEKLASE